MRKWGYSYAIYVNVVHTNGQSAFMHDTVLNNNRDFFSISWFLVDNIDPWRINWMDKKKSYINRKGHSDGLNGYWVDRLLPLKLMTLLNSLNFCWYLCRVWTELYVHYAPDYSDISLTTTPTEMRCCTMSK